MMTEEETANIVTLLGDLELDLRNGNVPASKMLIISIVNCLLLKHDLNWKDLGSFAIDNLECVETRKALLHFIPKLKELISPFQPEQEEDQE